MEESSSYKTPPFMPLAPLVYHAAETWRLHLTLGPGADQRTHTCLTENLVDFIVTEVGMAAVFDIDSQLRVLPSGCFFGIRAWFAGKRRIRVSKKAHRTSDLKQKPSIHLDQLPDPLIREADVIDLVGKDVFQHFRRRLIPGRSPDLAQSPKQIHLPSFKGTILNGEAGASVSHMLVTAHSKFPMGNSPL